MCAAAASDYGFYPESNVGADHPGLQESHASRQHLGIDWLLWWMYWKIWNHWRSWPFLMLIPAVSVHFQ
jgi:hypothetical protein